MSTIDQLHARLADVANSEEYKIQQVISEITEDVVARMTVKGMSRTDLARELGVSPAMITKLLRGQNNFTVRTLVQVATALGCTLSVRLPRCGSRTAPFLIAHNPTDTRDDSDSVFLEDGWAVIRDAVRRYRVDTLGSGVLPLDALTVPGLRELAKQRDVDIKGLRRRDQIIEALSR